MTNTTTSGTEMPRTVPTAEGKNRSDDVATMPRTIAREFTPNPLAEMVVQATEVQRRVEQARVEAELARARYAAD